MSANEKTAAQIDDFSAFYQALVEGNEPGTLAWQFYRGSDEKIYLIERYTDSDAALQHVTNISPGGIQEKEFGDFSDHCPPLPISAVKNRNAISSAPPHDVRKIMLLILGENNLCARV